MMHFLGLSAWVLFAFAFASAIRARFAARISGGIARQHRLHHWLGLTTGLLVLTHASYEIW
ncbi:MAG: hypothetical protein K8S54_01835, partial [Spirochaetia bacterium]|nr:hypothetical protein [Spirochaetia bacterium]